jgi:hypothetical protein
MKVDVLIGFVVDLIKRFIKPTPQFFKVLQFLGAVIFAVTGLPALIESLCSNVGVCIPLPEWWEGLYSKAISWASILSVLIAQLTVVSEEKKDLILKD